jgi:hypothetical protein
MSHLHRIGPWALVTAIACTACPEPASVPEPSVTEPLDAIARPPNPPLDIVISADELGPPRAKADAPLEDAAAPTPQPSFALAPVPFHSPKTVVSSKRRECSVLAVLDPEVLVVYSMIDVYALIAEAIELQPSLPQRAEHPPCAGGFCQADAPNPVLLEDGDDSAIDGSALGFVVPIGDGYWVLPIDRLYRQYHCFPTIDTQRVEDGHARLSIRHMVANDEDCDDVGPDEACEIGCFYAGATQYDLFYDAQTERALLVTREYEELDDADDPKPVIEVVHENDAVRISGCKSNRTIPWPPK